jgi:hypothetical protein
MIARRFKVKTIASDSGFGRFNLKADQVSPSTVFVSLPALSQDMGFEHRANILLISERPGTPLDIQVVNKAVKDVWTLVDAGLELREITERNFVELKSSRIFLDPPVVDAAINLSQKARPILTYFVNEIQLGNRLTPYSFVSAPGTPIVPSGIKDDEIVINAWLARDLDARVGDQIQMTYYVLGPRRDLKELSFPAYQ